MWWHHLSVLTCLSLCFWHNWSQLPALNIFSWSLDHFLLVLILLQCSHFPSVLCLFVFSNASKFSFLSHWFSLNSPPYTTSSNSVAWKATYAQMNPTSISLVPILTCTLPRSHTSTAYFMSPELAQTNVQNQMLDISPQNLLLPDSSPF